MYLIPRYFFIPTILITLIFTACNFGKKHTKPRVRLFIPNIAVDSSFIVLIDAGHGGMDSGEIADSAKVDPKKKIDEKTLNLKLALLIAKQNNDSNIKIIFTRNKDTFVTLKDRVIKTRNVRPNLFLSIHANDAYPDTTIRGFDMYTVDKNNPNYNASINFGNSLIKAFSTIKGFAINGFKTKKERLFVLRNATYPALLLEMGYMSNRLDFSGLLETNTQLEIINKLLFTIKNYKNTISPILRYTCTNWNYNFSVDTTRTFKETQALSAWAVPVVDGLEYNNLLLSEINPDKITKISQHSASAEEVKKYGPIAYDGIIDFVTVSPDSSFLFKNQMEKIMWWANKINKDSNAIAY